MWLFYEVRSERLKLGVKQFSGGATDLHMASTLSPPIFLNFFLLKPNPARRPGLQPS